MKQIRIIVFVFFLVSYNCILFSKTISLELESKPYNFKIYEGKIYVSEISKLNVYNLKNHKLQYSIGRKGQGPGEFSDVPVPQVVNGQLIVSCDRKILYYNKEGKFLKESKVGTWGSSLKKFYEEEKYFGMDIVNKPERYEVSYNLYNKLFVKEKSIYSFEWMLKKNRKKDLYEVFFYDSIQKNMAFAHADKFVIDIIDRHSKLITKIKHNNDRIVFSEKDKQKVIQYWKSDPRYRKNYKAEIKRTIFPEYFPYIATCRVYNDKIYVITYFKKRGKSKCFKFSKEGKLLGKYFIDLKMTSPFFNDLMFDIYNDKLYQLVDNEETEKWELEIVDIKKNK